MRIINNLLQKKTAAEPHDFSHLISNRNKLVVFLPEDILDSYNILCHIAGWKDLYKELLIFVPHYSHSFFSRLEVGENFTYEKFSIDKKSCSGCSILNFKTDKNIVKFLNHCQGSTIVDTSNESNLQFVPEPKTVLEVVEKFATFSNLPFKNTKLSFELTKAEQFNNKQKYFHNRFPDFVLDIKSNITTRKLEGLISNLKMTFSANIYLTHKSSKNIDFPNLEIIQMDTLFQLYQYAISCNLFFTTDRNLAGLLHVLNKSCLHLGEGLNTKQVISVKINDFDNLQETIPKLMTKVQ